MNISQEDVAIFKIEGEHLQHFDSNSFLELFMEGNALSEYSQKVDGIASLNCIHKTFSVRFKVANATLPVMFSLYGKGKYVQIQNG